MGSIRVIENGAFADFEFEAYGETLPDLFAQCGKAVFMAITDIDTISASQKVEFEVSGETLEDLLFAFLSELIFLKDTRKMFFCDFAIEITGSYQLYCKAMGETIDRQKHQTKTDVKAPTYHKLKITQDETGFGAKVILDL
jgi:SHS2 domain-containing protein